MEMIIISGLSGAARAASPGVLEDMDFYCVDNKPEALMPKNAELCIATRGGMSVWPLSRMCGTLIIRGAFRRSGGNAGHGATADIHPVCGGDRGGHCQPATRRRAVAIPWMWTAST
jgi:hypothetical protein